MNFITTFNKPIYYICGKQLIESFINTKNNEDHKLIIFFENDDDLFTDYYPEWLVEWSNEPSLLFVNLMNYEYDGEKIIPKLDKTLSPKISFTDEYSSPRSVKWFRPVAAMKYASEILEGDFCSIDSDCVFTNKVEESFFKEMMNEKNIAFLGRENFKTMRHGAYDPSGNYVHTKTVEATKKDTHTETGFICFNRQLEGTDDFINRNFEYWVNGDILNLEFKTDCHSFDAVRKELFLSYLNLCEPMGDLSPIGSRVIENSIVGSFMIHHKGTIGPILYANNLLK